MECNSLGAERREHKRVAARMAVSLFDSKGNKRLGLARNISAGGISIECDFTMNKGAVVNVEFVLPVRNSFKVIKASARAVNIIYRGAVQKMSIGFEFVSIDEKAQEFINLYAKDRVSI